MVVLFASSGAVLSSYSCLDSVPRMNSAPVNGARILKYFEAHEKGIPSLSTKTDHKAEIEKVLGEELEAVFTGRQDVDTALTNAKTRSDAILTAD